MKTQVRIEDQLFEVEIIDPRARPIVAVVDGERFEVWPAEAAALTPAAPPAPSARPASSAPASPPPPAPSAAGAANFVLAPIPGVILSLSVQPGQTVTAGQELCILEAMKMKSAIRATRAGTIKAILVAAGEQVKHRQALLEYQA